MPTAITQPGSIEERSSMIHSQLVLSFSGLDALSDEMQ